MAGLKGHLQEHIAKYATLAVSILTPVAGLLGSEAANLGGADTKVGHALLGASAALGAAVAGIVYIKNLGIWQMLDKFGVAPGVVTPRTPLGVAGSAAKPGDPVSAHLGVQPIQAGTMGPSGPGMTPPGGWSAGFTGAIPTVGEDDEPGDNFDALPHHPVVDPVTIPPDNVDLPADHPVRS